MRANNYTHVLLKKFILNQCSEAEIVEVITYFQEITESEQLPSVEDVLELLEHKPLLSEVDANRILNNIINTENKLQRIPLKKKSSFWKYAAAASVLLVVSLTIFLNNESESLPIDPIIVNTTIEPGTDKAILTLGNGSQMELKEGSLVNTQNAKSNGKEIIYDNIETSSSEVVYNYLTIPRGGQFYVKLSDGTQVWLNSETQLKYPVSFTEGESRNVELVYGEAYFDVSPSIEHNGAHFKVISKVQEIDVLGTEFNIKAYKDESNIYTTLVEGKVEINTATEKHLLAPNQQSNVDIFNNTILVGQVDINTEISWKKGIFCFKEKSLKDIMRVISRWYDIEVIFENKNLENIIFKGTISRELSIEEILSIMKSSTINEYEIKNKIITLK